MIPTVAAAHNRPTARLEVHSSTAASSLEGQGSLRLAASTRRAPRLGQAARNRRPSMAPSIVSAATRPAGVTKCR
jgi:hypothetical protein